MKKKKISVMKLIGNCEYCKNLAPHMIVVVKENGEIHIHAPFENKYIMDRFIEAIKKEQEIYDMKKSFDATNEKE